MDRAAWQDAVHSVAKSQTWLKWLSTQGSIEPLRPCACCYSTPRWNLSLFSAMCFRLQPLTGALPLLTQTTTQEWLSELSEANGQLSKWLKLRNAKTKWLSEEALQIAEERREAKGRGEKVRYTHLNAEFQRIARRDKKAFLSDQCKEIKENNRMGKTRDLFKKIRDTKGTLHANMGSIKDRNGMDLTEAEDIKKRWQKYREELYEKDLHDQIITMVVSLT